MSETFRHREAREAGADGIARVHRTAREKGHAPFFPLDALETHLARTGPAYWRGYLPTVLSTEDRFIIAEEDRGVLIIAPQAEIVRGVTTVRHHLRGRDENQAGTAKHEAQQMGQVPVMRQPIARRIPARSIRT
ncbi:MAG: hypothetical protein GDA49_05120 [Rhodospirillales bacterium]|nr:hypothetical protein [Rhodospirillales bacterium]